MSKSTWFRRSKQKCVHMYVNAKMMPVETIPGIRGVGVKESSRRDELKFDIFDTL
jgi:hypothetical protein